MSKELSDLVDYITKKIPSAEILNVSHTERIFHQADLDCDSTPVKEGILVLFTNCC